MLALGLLLLLLTGTAGALLVLDNPDPVAVSVYGTSIPDLTVGTLFLAGAATGLVFLLGVLLLLSGARRTRVSRHEARVEDRRARQEKKRLAEENAALRTQLAETAPAEPPVDSQATR